MSVPLAIASVPIWQACRITIRQAMDGHGVGSASLRRASAAWPTVWRNLVRRPARLALTLALLMAGGAMFMTALNVSSSWDKTVAKVYATRHYDIEIRSHAAMPADTARVWPRCRSAEFRAQRIRELERRLDGWGFVELATLT